MTMYTPELVEAKMQERERIASRRLHTNRKEPTASPRSGRFALVSHAVAKSFRYVARATRLGRAA